MSEDDLDPNLEQDLAADASAGDSELKKLQAERDSLYERLARTTADFQNARRRLEADKEQALQYANSALIRSLLPVIDNWERALNVDPTKVDSAAVLKGLQVVHDSMMAVLKQQQVEVIAPEPGTPFDPSKHEALLHQPNEQYTEPTVTQLLQPGYALHGRTLRPAQVSVSTTH